jgi:glycosyltransferase involved in cell wall biosynthesis
VTAAGARRPLRLLQVNPTRGWRGGEAQTLFLCRGLAAMGHEVLLAAAPGDELARRAREGGIAVHGATVRGDADLFGIAGVASAALAFRPDVVHLHTSRAHAAGWALTFLLRRTPFVVSRRVDFAPARNPLTRAKYTTRTDAFIAVSARVAQILLESGVPGGRVHTVYSGVPARQRPAEPRLRALRDELRLPATAPLLGAVGALAPHKDPLTLIAAFAQLRARRPDVHLLLVGEGSMRGAIERDADRLGVSDAVTLTGFRADPIDCLALLDVFVASSHLEGLNTSVLDAMSLGVPVVATRAGGIPELVQDGQTGLLAAPRDPSALASGMLAMLDDPARARRMGEAGRERSHAFSVERMVRETLDVYHRVIAARSNGSGQG